LQMYWPESCCAARGMTKLPFSTRCCQGRGARSFDHSMRGAGSPTGQHRCPSPWRQATAAGHPSPATALHPPRTSGRAVQRGGVPSHHGDGGRRGDLGGTGVPLRRLHVDVHPGLRRAQGAVCRADIGPGVLRLGWRELVEGGQGGW